MSKRGLSKDIKLPSNFEDAFYMGISGLVNYSTYGLVGYDKDKGFTSGVTAHAIDEGFGEISGRNFAREQSNKTTELLRKEQGAASLQRNQEYMQRYQEDRAASLGAPAARASTRGVGRNISDSFLGTDQDFLGL